MDRVLWETFDPQHSSLIFNNVLYVFYVLYRIIPYYRAWWQLLAKKRPFRRKKLNNPPSLKN